MPEKFHLLTRSGQIPKVALSLSRNKPPPVSRHAANVDARVASLCFETCRGLSKMHKDSKLCALQRTSAQSDHACDGAVPSLYNYLDRVEPTGWSAKTIPEFTECLCLTTPAVLWLGQCYCGGVSDRTEGGES
jgi:hypothetical protein